MPASNPHESAFAPQLQEKPAAAANGREEKPLVIRGLGAWQLPHAPCAIQHPVS